MYLPLNIKPLNNNVGGSMIRKHMVIGSDSQLAVNGNIRTVPVMGSTDMTPLKFINEGIDKSENDHYLIPFDFHNYTNFSFVQVSGAEPSTIDLSTSPARILMSDALEKALFRQEAAYSVGSEIKAMRALTTTLIQTGSADLPAYGYKLSIPGDSDPFAFNQSQVFELGRTRPHIMWSRSNSNRKYLVYVPDESEAEPDYVLIPVCVLFVKRKDVQPAYFIKRDASLPDILYPQEIAYGRTFESLLTPITRQLTIIETTLINTSGDIKSLIQGLNQSINRALTSCDAIQPLVEALLDKVGKLVNDGQHAAAANHIDMIADTLTSNDFLNNVQQLNQYRPAQLQRVVDFLSSNSDLMTVGQLINNFSYITDNNSYNPVSALQGILPSDYPRLFESNGFNVPCLFAGGGGHVELHPGSPDALYTLMIHGRLGSYMYNLGKMRVIVCPTLIANTSMLYEFITLLSVIYHSSFRVDSQLLGRLFQSTADCSKIVSALKDAVVSENDAKIATSMLYKKSGGVFDNSLDFDVLDRGCVIGFSNDPTSYRPVTVVNQAFK